MGFIIKFAGDINSCYKRKKTGNKPLGAFDNLWLFAEVIILDIREKKNESKVILIPDSKSVDDHSAESLFGISNNLGVLKLYHFSHEKYS